MTVKYLEIVTPNVDAACAMYSRIYGVEFGAEVPTLGMARTAERPDGTTFSVRAPLADHDGPIVRTYLAVDDMDAAIEAATANGGVVAYGPVEQGDVGTFAIVIQDGVQHGFWVA